MTASLAHGLNLRTRRGLRSDPPPAGWSVGRPSQNGRRNRRTVGRSRVRRMGTRIRPSTLKTRVYENNHPNTRCFFTLSIRWLRVRIPSASVNPTHQAAGTWAYSARSRWTENPFSVPLPGGPREGIPAADGCEKGFSHQHLSATLRCSANRPWC